MKRLLIYICLLSLLLLSSCASEKNIKDQPASETETIAVDSTDTEQQTTSSQAEQSTVGNTPTSEIRSDVSSGSNYGYSENDFSDNVESADQPQSPKIPETSQDTKIGTSSSSEPSSTPKQEPSPPSSKDPPTETPSVHYATAADAKEIAAKMVEYINSYRIEQGSSAAINLPGLTKYAEYRSRQIITNFEHDTIDERAAATALKYGEYIDPALYGMDGEPYYRANAREALAKAGYVGTVDSVAQRLALQIRDSASHWTYIGSLEYRYMAVGVTYENGTWYCVVAVSSVNTDEY